MYKDSKPKKPRLGRPRRSAAERYKRRKIGFNVYVGEVLTERVFELGMTQAQIAREHVDSISQPALSRILNGIGNTSINTLAIVADILGMDIIIQPKQTKKEKTDEDKD